ncbi:MAG TPA: hypothetical protein VFJ64_08915 [Solirubrobacterales bacterium]|nr:hypothetical protein [Solirubrobacterales bacterium]
MQAQPIQRAILALALEAHPKSLTIPDLARELGAQEVESAVAALATAGLLSRDGGAINASAAALYFERLELP